MSAAAPHPLLARVRLWRESAGIGIVAVGSAVLQSAHSHGICGVCLDRDPDVGIAGSLVAGSVFACDPLACPLSRGGGRVGARDLIGTFHLHGSLRADRMSI